MSAAGLARGIESLNNKCVVNIVGQTLVDSDPNQWRVFSGLH